MNLRYQDSTAIIRALLGDPVKGNSTASDWRYGPRGHLSVVPARGVWHDKKADKGGGLFDLVVYLGHAKNRSEAAEWLKAGNLMPANAARVYCGETLHQKAERLAAEAKEAEVKRARATEIWDQAQPVTDTPAFIYLTEARCIPESVLEGVSTLRFHPNVPFHPYTRGGYVYPALVALVQGPDGEAVGVHLTYLLPDGAGKADLPTPRKFCGKGFNGASVRLGDGPALIVGEGIESALSAGHALGLTPVAALSATGIKTFQRWNGVKSVAFAPDIDASGLGMRDARSAAERLHHAGVKVAGFAIPPDGLNDWNDAARAGLLNKEARS
jgi:hypothetical protein